MLTPVTTLSLQITLYRVCLSLLVSPYDLAYYLSSESLQLIRFSSHMNQHTIFLNIAL